MRMNPQFLLACMLMAASGVVSAQAPPAPTTPPAPTAPPAVARAADCAPTQPVPQRGTVAPEGTTTGQRTEPLGDKLARSDGVLCPPPAVVPDTPAPPPAAGTTPTL